MDTAATPRDAGNGAARGVRLTVLGSAGSYPGPGRACSSYLLESEGYRLLLDCGNGAMTNLMRVCDPAAVDALVVSHAHPDHWSDAVGLHIARRWHRDGPQPLPLHGPAGLGDLVGRVTGDPADWAALHPFTAVADGAELELGPFHLAFRRTAHPVETLASRVTVDGRVVAYSADSGPTPVLAEVARDADLFLADCTWPASAGPVPPDLHMTGAEAGEVAAEAGAATLLVTHVLPVHDPAELAAEAATAFDGAVRVAEDLLAIDL